MLQIATLDDGDIQLTKEEVDINLLMTSVVENIELSISESGGEIIFEEKALESFILVDKLHITNIIHNLLDNAIKYSGQAPIIHLKTKNSSEGLEITVSDNGTGMTKQQINLVFQKFYRVPTGNVHNIKGFGLGLYYVKLIVEAHQGNIDLQSEPGKGTTFNITLPKLQP